MILNSPTISGSLTVTGNIITSGSITLSGSVASASYAATASFVALAQSASNAVSAETASFANAFTVASTLTAQTLVVQTITSSVDFVTGSTRFGSIAANTHMFTGSVSISGSLIVSGTMGTGDLLLSNQSIHPNEVDGTQGSWLIQEGKDDLFIINQSSGKKYKFNLIEI
jgi:cytoskeletal protein CcmA (bactofilin family)